MDTILYLLTTLFLSQAIIIMITKAEKTARIDENQSQKLQCSAGEVLLITYATYDGQAVFCKTNDVTSVVQTQCQWKRSCTIHAVDSVYKDTCRGPNELLFVRYNCQDDCYYHINGQLFYNGTVSITTTGKTCQLWDDDEPHEPKHRPKGDGQRNYCRNPDGDNLKPWCYTTDPDTRWEYCDVQKCEIAPFSTTTQLMAAQGPENEDDTPVTIVLGVLFGLLVTSVILVVVFLILKRRGTFQSEPKTTDQRRSYIYTAPENDKTLIARVRKLIRWNRKSDNEGSMLANNPGYSAMQGERIEAVDYANAPIVKARVYETPNTTNDKHNQMYTSLYDSPNGTGTSPQDTTNVEGSNANEFYENQYEVPQPHGQSSKPTVAVKPVTKKPKPTPKPAPRADRQRPDSTVPVIANSDNNRIDLTSIVPSGNSSDIKDAKYSPNEQRKKTHLSPETVRHADSASSLVKLQIEKFNKS